MSRLTAQQARDLCGDAVDREVDHALNLIRQYCKPSLKAGQRGFKFFTDFWAKPSQDRTKACSILNELGYKTIAINEVTGGFKNLDEFLESGMLISWENKT